MKKNIFYISLALLTSAAVAADITIEPPADGGFSIIKPDATPLFRIDANTGGVYLENLPAELGNVPLCWNSSSKILSACDSSQSGASAPTISTDAPSSVINSNPYVITVTCADEVELLTCGGVTTPAGAKVFSTKISRNGEWLGGSYENTLSATNMRGGAAKTSIVVKAPKTAIPLGDYSSVSATTPAAFDCSPPSNENSVAVRSVHLYAGSGDYTASMPPWSTTDGYILQVQIVFDQSVGPTMAEVMSVHGGPINGGIGPGRLPLAATNATFPITHRTYGSGSQMGVTATASRGSVTYNPSTKELSVTAIRMCGSGSDLNSLTWIEGQPFSFTARQDM